MTKIKMLKTGNGSDVDDKGVMTRPQAFIAGQEYQVGDELAKTFVDELKWAVRVDESASAQDPDAAPDKFEGAPENKAKGGKRRK